MSAAAFARQHHAGVAADHVGRYRLLAERGVSTVFVSLPDLAGPDDLSRLAPIVGLTSLPPRYAGRTAPTRRPSSR